MAASGRFLFNSVRLHRQWAWADRPPIPQDRGPFGPGTAREEARTLGEADTDTMRSERRAV